MPSLKNAQDRLVTVNLDHESCCTPTDCHCEKVVRREGVALPGGGAGVRETPRLICASLTLLPGELQKNVPEWAFKAVEMQPLLRTRKLRRVD